MRSFAAVDVENLLGGTRPTLAAVRYVHDKFYDLAQLREGGLSLVGLSHDAVGPIAMNWPHSAGRFVRSGVDGADQALVEAIRDMPHLEDYSYVVIGSGDHYFAPIARSLNKAGVFVHVISRPTALSRELRKAATMVTHLEISNDLFTTAA